MDGKSKNIYDFIVEQETAMSVPIFTSDWEWNLKEHVKTGFYYKYGRLLTGNADDKPVKNIVRPILNLAYRAEDIDVKDISIYVNNPEKYHLSFLIKKYHDDVFVVENDLDTFIDELKESKIDYGGGLSKYMGGGSPEVVPLQSIAFCDQTNILSGPIGIKHYFSPDQLQEKASVGWGNAKYGATASIDDVIALSEAEKVQEKDNASSKTPSKYIEVYEVHGSLPEAWLNDERTDYERTVYVRQMHIICFYKNKNNEKTWITLFRAKEKKNPFKFVDRDKVFGRALGFGGVEEIAENQVWVNFSMIQKRQMLEAASKTILKTTDAAFANRNKVGDMDNLEIAVLEDGKDISQIDTQPRSMVLFDRWDEELQAHAQQMGAANDSIMGKNPSAGTPFKLQELVTQESQGLHNYRRGKFAKHLEEIYTDWIIPYISKKITEGFRFLSELTLDELQYVADCVVRNEAKKYVTERVLNGEVVQKDEVDAYKENVRKEFIKGGNKRFLELLEGELEDSELKVKISISGKQKNLAEYTDKLVNILRQLIQAPQMLDDPRIAKIFNEIIESSGLTPVDFYNKPENAQPVAMQQMQQLQPAQTA